MLERPADSERLVDLAGPLGANEPLRVREQDVAVLVQNGQIAGVVTSQTQRPADYRGAHALFVRIALFEGMRFGGPVPLPGVRGVFGEADLEVVDPVRLVEAMLASGVDVGAVEVWIPERIMVCVTEVLTQLRGRAKANAIIAAILSCTAGMEEEMGVVVRDIGRIRVQKTVASLPR